MKIKKGKCFIYVIFMKRENNKVVNKPDEIEFLTLDDDQDTKKTKTKKKIKQKKSKEIHRKNQKCQKKKGIIKKEKPKKSKIGINKGWFLILLLVVLFFGGVSFNIIQKSLVRNEIESLERLVQEKQLDYNKIEQKLNKMVSIGNYKKVEKAFKDYLSDVVENTKYIHSLTDTDKLSNVLSAENLKNDGPNFENTEKKLKSTKTNLIIKFNNLIELMSKEKIMSYAKQHKISKKYIDFYTEVAIENNENLSSMQQSLKKSLEYYTNTFDTMDKAIKYLKNHKTWKIEDNKLVFTTSKDFKEYNKIVGALNQK